MTTLPTHDQDLNFPLILESNAAGQDFGLLLLLVPGSANSLDGDRTRTYTSLAAATDDQGNGFISAETLAGLTVAFAQVNANGTITSIMVGRVDDSEASPAVKASADLGASGAGTLDTVVEAHTAGAAGTGIEVAWIGDRVSGVAIEVLNSGRTVVIHYQAGTSTVGDVETAITALSGADDVIDVKTGGTSISVLASADASSATLAGGADAVVTESYADGLAACIADDDSFYAVAIASRDSTDILAVADYVEAQGVANPGKRMIFIAQSSDADWLESGGPAAFADYIGTTKRTALVYHDDDTQWLDLAWACGRINFDLDAIAPGWDSAAVSGVDAYGSLTQAGRANALANHANVMLAYGTTSDTVVKAGSNLAGDAFEEVVTGDWATIRVRDNVADLAVTRARDGLRVPMSAEGQALQLAEIEAVLQTGESIGHFVKGQTRATALPITSSDRTARHLRYTWWGQSAVSNNTVTGTLYLSTTAVNATA